MIEDIRTVMWKEYKGLLWTGSSRKKTLLVLLAPIVLCGIVLPIQLRGTWLSSAWSLGIAFIVPLMLLTSTIAGSFAGERERHTLETLLASRLPDRAILLGKLLLSLGFGWGMTLLFLVISLVVVNILEWNGRLQLFEPTILWTDIALSLLTSGLVANLGILVSLRSRTVQSAGQTIMSLLFIPALVLQAIVFLLPTFLPVEEIKAALGTLDFDSILLAGLAIVLVLDLALLMGALARFQRSKLLL